MKKFLNRTNILFWISKIILVGVFLYFGIESIFDPNIYGNLVPEFVTKFISPEIAVIIHGGVEVVCALLILFGLGSFLPYIILLISFLGVLISVSGTTLIRDIGILAGILLLTHIQIKREN